MFDLWDVFQHYQIKEAKQATRDLRDQQCTERDAQAQELRRLESKIDGLALVTQALVELLQAQGVSEQAIVAKVREIDLRDGQLDGKMGRKAQACTSCGRTVHPRQRACMYCGTAAASSEGLPGVVS
ncbi:hypothetical protein HNQ51_002363 [Inhella inkyongensis]|uniref:ChsH2 rubredoxin-like zinc ribbon domain-containing protein n=1 Tax=Inhella inkyongensis TaxID=392593 RepID=A0A840S8C1_9BURK|nr:zinc ribbon domain-containing protein [Inhella inkyongensis]MBB5205044.1 hypothetical protein [Inhella inkyongensis]